MSVQLLLLRFVNKGFSWKIKIFDSLAQRCARFYQDENCICSILMNLMDDTSIHPLRKLIIWVFSPFFCHAIVEFLWYEKILKVSPLNTSTSFFKSSQPGLFTFLSILFNCNLYNQHHNIKLILSIMFAQLPINQQSTIKSQKQCFNSTLSITAQWIKYLFNYLVC